VEEIAHKRKIVRYQSDEDTYHTNDESTFGSSFKSSRSGATVERQKELSLLQHVDIAMTAVAASLGGLLGSPTKADDEKSLDTDQDDNTNAQSTLLSDTNTKQSGDWFGYVERVLFPSNEAENVRLRDLCYYCMFLSTHLNIVHYKQTCRLRVNGQLLLQMNTPKANTRKV
jgi:hypothetical protein